MSGENIVNLIREQALTEEANAASQYENQRASRTYERRFKEPPKPPYSTFWERGKEYDGTHPRFFKQRDAVIGRNVGDTIDPKVFLRRGEGIRHIVPPVHEDKIILKPPLDQGTKPFGGLSGNESGNEGNNGENEGKGGNGAESGWCDCSKNCVCCDPNGAGEGNGKGNSKHFPSLNIVEVTNMVPRRRKLQPEYPTDRKDFGKVPLYLSRIKKEIQNEKNYIATLEGRDSPGQKQYASYVYKLDNTERTGLLAKLRKKLEEHSATLNKMPLSQDSLSTSKKKGELQNVIKDIEKAISKIDRETIFVYKDIPPYTEWAKNSALKEARTYAAEQQRAAF